MNEDPFKNKPAQPLSKPDVSESSQEKLEITIDLAKVGDWEEYRQIRLEAIENNPEAFGSYPEKFIEEVELPQSAWKDELLDPMKFVVLVKEGTYAQGLVRAIKKIDKKGVESWRISSVYLTPKLQGAGIAQKMVEKVIDEIKSRGGKRIVLNVNKAETQKPAFELYRKLGFQIVKRLLESYHGFYEMEKDLTREMSKK